MWHKWVLYRSDRKSKDCNDEARQGKILITDWNASPSNIQLHVEWITFEAAQEQWKTQKFLDQNAAK